MARVIVGLRKNILDKLNLAYSNLADEKASPEELRGGFTSTLRRVIGDATGVLTSDSDLAAIQEINDIRSMLVELPTSAIHRGALQRICQKIRASLDTEPGRMRAVMEMYNTFASEANAESRRDHRDRDDGSGRGGINGSRTSRPGYRPPAGSNNASSYQRDQHRDRDRDRRYGDRDSDYDRNYRYYDRREYRGEPWSRFSSTSASRYGRGDLYHGDRDTMYHRDRYGADVSSRGPGRQPHRGDDSAVRRLMSVS
jgi:hypothetical protein